MHDHLDAGVGQRGGQGCGVDALVQGVDDLDAHPVGFALEGHRNLDEAQEGPVAPSPMNSVSMARRPASRARRARSATLAESAGAPIS